MTSFELDSDARITHLGARKEGPTDARILACDLKLDVTTSNDILLALHGKLRLLLFTEDGKPRLEQMGRMEWNQGFRGMVLELVSAGHPDLKFLGVTVKDFDIAYAKTDGKVQLVFKAQVKPDNGQFELLGKMLIADTVRVRVHPGIGDLFDDSSPAAAAQRLHETAKADGASVTVISDDGAGGTRQVHLGALTDDVIEKMKNFGAAEAAKHEDDRDFDEGRTRAYQALGLSKQFVDEYLTELEAAYTEGWESIPADSA